MGGCLETLEKVQMNIIFVPYNGFFMIASMNQGFYAGLSDWAKAIVDAGLDAALKEANRQWVSITEEKACRVLAPVRRGFCAKFPTSFAPAAIMKAPRSQVWLRGA